MSSDYNLDDIRRDIYRTFSGTIAPKNREDLVDGYSSDDYDHVNVVESFGRKQWEGLSQEFLVCNSSAVNFFSPTAFGYFLPAYLVHGSDFSPDGETVRELVVFALLHICYTRDNSPLLSVMRGLSKPQAEVLIRCLACWKGHFPHDCMEDEIELFLTKFRDIRSDMH